MQGMHAVGSAFDSVNARLLKIVAEITVRINERIPLAVKGHTTMAPTRVKRLRIVVACLCHKRKGEALR